MLLRNISNYEIVSFVLWEIKVGALYKQHQLSANKYAIALKYLISLFTEWPS